MPVVVVTDSSARIPAKVAAEAGIRVVPLHVLVDGLDLLDGIDEAPADLYTRGSVTTAGATPVELARAFRQALADSEGDGVVAVHISHFLSSTANAAKRALIDVPALAFRLAVADWDMASDMNSSAREDGEIRSPAGVQCRCGGKVPLR